MTILTFSVSSNFISTSFSVFLFSKISGTSLLTILIASPSATAVLPTPGSPKRTGLFLVLLARIWITRSISFSRPTTGSNLNSEAASVKSVPNSSRLGVLVFPLDEDDELEDEDDEEECEDVFNPETGELLLGDIIISVDKVISQAEEYGHSRERELGFLVAHSMLHLFGYDHMEDEERKVMEAKQSEILNKIGLVR